MISLPQSDHQSSERQSTLAELNEAEHRFRRVLEAAHTALTDTSVDHLAFGGIAACLYGRPWATTDVDFLIRQPDAERALAALKEVGFETEMHDRDWIAKAFLEGVLVDLIFRITGEIYLDDDMVARGRDLTFVGVPLRVVAPEDAVVIEAASHRLERDGHWFTALRILATQDMDWDYFVRRARNSTRRMLSLLVYAESIDLTIPPSVIETMIGQAYPELGKHR